MAPIRVPTHNRLTVSYTFYKAANPKSCGVIVLHHGICHTRKHFEKLIVQLNGRGIHVVMIEQQSGNGGYARNGILARQYREGMAKAMEAIQSACQRQGLHVSCYVLHSMGALIGEEVQQEWPELQLPTVLMAPIPVLGALPVTLRILRDDFWNYWRAVWRLDIHFLATTFEQVKRLFFAPETKDATVKEAKAELKHAPFLMYCQLVLRPLSFRRWIINNKLPKRMLLFSESDYIFDPDEFGQTRKLYAPLEEHEISGGHDFFIEHASEAADWIEAFYHQHAARPASAGPDEGGPDEAGPPIPAPHGQFGSAGKKLPEKQVKSKSPPK